MAPGKFIKTSLLHVRRKADDATLRIPNADFDKEIYALVNDPAPDQPEVQPEPASEPEGGEEEQEEAGEDDLAAKIEALVDGNSKKELLAIAGQVGVSIDAAWNKPEIAEAILKG